MKKSTIENYRCPITGSSLSLKDPEFESDLIKSGTLTNDRGDAFPIENFLPDFTWPKELLDVDDDTREAYDKLALEYDKYANIPFQTFRTTNEAIRELITSKLGLKEKSKVLEIGGGDGRGAEFILKYIPEGELYFQELSPSFLNQAMKRLAKYKDRIEFSIANASYLSFPDNSFDAAHHFGGISTFAEKERCLKELCRVVKPGGKIVFGDEGIGPWLRDSEMGKIMINSNPLIGVELPLEDIPVEARNVNVSWIMMGAYYIVDLEVGDGPPSPDYFVPIPSDRGGNHWIRYYGQLEGVSDEVKKLAIEARKKSGKSMHDWLNDVIYEAARKEL